MVYEKDFETSGLKSESVIDFVEETVESNDIPPDTAIKISICTDEIVANILSHSNARYINVKVAIDNQTATVKISFTDNGEPFNPITDVGDPDVTIPLEDRNEGGLGVYIVKKMMKGITYERENDCNVFTIST